MEKVSLKPDHLLMDPDFEGYKLSLEALSVRSTPLESPIVIRCPDDEQYSFFHAKLFGQSNLLVMDPFDATGETIFLINSGQNVISKVVNYSGESRNPELVTVFSYESSCSPSRSGDYNPSLTFASPSLAVFADGRGRLSMLTTNNRCDDNQPQWTLLFQDEICGPQHPFVVTSAVTELANSVKMLHFLILYVDSFDKIVGTFERGTKKSQFANVVEWFSFADFTETPIASWRLERVRRYLFDGSINYLELDKTAKTLMFSTDKPFKIIFDSDGILEEPEEENEVVSKAPYVPSFFWMQGVEDMVIWVILPEGTTKRDLKVTLHSSEIYVKVGDVEKINGKLWNVLDSDSMTWTIQNGNKLEITACKACEGLVWKRLLRDETLPDGEEVNNPAIVEDCQRQLANLNFEQVTDDGEPRDKIYNFQELEDCDNATDSEFYFYALNSLGKVGTVVNISGRQWLFNLVSTEPDAPPSLCLTHDVDALVWSPTTKEQGFELKHSGTLRAFGYVQASKQQKKFILASSDLSYSVICDLSRHIFIYREPTPMASECQLRNRKSGKDVKTVAKQHVVTLDTTNEIVGAIATPKYLFLATTRFLYSVHVNI